MGSRSQHLRKSLQEQWKATGEGRILTALWTPFPLRFQYKDVPNHTAAMKDQRDLQLGVYALAAREVFRFDPLRLSYYYLETSERVTVDKPSERLEEDRQTIVSVADGIRAELFPAKPDRMKCSACDFKLLCPSAAV